MSREPPRDVAGDARHDAPRDAPRDVPAEAPEPSPQPGWAVGSVVHGARPSGVWDTSAEDVVTPRTALGRDPAQRYDVAGELGAGGMGVVCSAHDRVLDRQVAHKRVAVGQGSGPELLARFVREARITAYLEHPAIVPVYDAGEADDGTPYYTMRLIRGRSLRDALAEAADLQARLRLLRHLQAACEAVAYAHQKGVVHRDLKPDNVMVGAYGETQVVDWGLARRARDLPEGSAGGDSLVGAGLGDEDDGGATPPAAARGVASATPPDSSVTRVGAVIGTPAYMSPEQALGHVADARSDVWSLGVMLWELLSGDRPDEAFHQIALRRADDPAWLGERAGPRALYAIVARALRPDPEDRYSDAKALADDVARFLDGRLVEAHVYSPAEQLRRLARAWRGPLVVAAVATCLLVGLGLFAARRTGLERDRAIAAEAQTRETMEQSNENLRLALVQKADAALRDGRRAEAEVFAANALRLAPSPSARGTLAGFGVAPRPQLVGDHPLPACDRLAPGPEGATVLCVAGDAVLFYDVPSAARQPQPRVSAVDRAPLALRWRRARAREGTLLVRPIPGVGPTDTLTEPADPAAPVGDALLLGDRVGVYAKGRRSHARWLSTRDGTPMPRRLWAVDHAMPWPMAWDRQGARSEAVGTSDGDVYVADTIGSRTHRACALGGLAIQARLSPEGQRIAVMCSLGWLRVVDLEGNPLPGWTRTGLDHRTNGVAAIAWLPDGAHVVVAGRTGDLAVVRLRDSRVVLRGRVHVGGVQAMAVGRQGANVAVWGTQQHVEVWNARTGAVLGRVPGAGVTDLRLSASGAVVTTFGRRVSVWRLPSAPHVDRLSQARPPVGLAFAALSPDGATVAIGKANGWLEVRALRDGALLLRDRWQRRVLKSASFSPDGRSLLVACAGTRSMRLYDTRTWRPLWTSGVGGHKRAALLSSGRVVAAAFVRRLLTYDATGVVLDAAAAPLRVVDMSRTADGAALWVATIGGAVWSLHEPSASAPGQLHAAKLEGPTQATALAVSPEGRTLAVAATRRLRVFEVEPGHTQPKVTHAFVLGDLARRTFDVAVNPGGSLVAAGLVDGTCEVWRVRDRTLLATLRGHVRQVSSVDFGPRGQLLTTASWDGDVRLWDIAALERDPSALVTEVERAWGVTLRQALARSLK